MKEPYEKLSEVYDSGWGDFSIQYVDWINTLLAERGITQGRILDVACGTGCLAIKLAQCGHLVHGIDISPQMIKAARSRSKDIDNISFEIQDMSRLSINMKFDLAVCSYDSINYLRNLKQIRAMLSRVSSVLDEKGLFIFDSNTAKLYQSHSDETIKLQLDGQDILQHFKYDSRRNEGITSFSFPDGTYEVHRQRPYDYDKLSPVLESSGLHTLHRFSWFDRTPYSPDTQKLFCITEKN